MDPNFKQPPIPESTQNIPVTPPPDERQPKLEKPEITDPAEPEKVQVHDTKKHEGLKSILTTVIILILAPLIALALTAFIFQSYQVDGQSMETTLQDRDRLIVLKLPRTWSKLTRGNYIPNRGDVVIFDKHNLYDYDGAGQKKQLVKRVIGLPGDRVVVKKGKVTIFNKEHPKGFEPDKTLPYGKVITTTPGAVDINVGAGQVYVMGDNRNNSLDSRIFGPISSKDIVGKLIMRIFPFNKAKTF